MAGTTATTDGVMPHARNPLAVWAVAAQRLEGWTPDADEVGGLDQLADGAITIHEYLGRCRRRYAGTAGHRPPVLARRRPYLIRGTDVLENNLGLTQAQVLARAEHAISAGRTVGMLARPPRDVTVPDVHRALFADVYPWAGEPRLTGIAKSGVAFSGVHEIGAGLARTQRDVAEAWACADGYGATAMAHRLARIYADYNLVHPFREGNGRTGVLMLALIAMRGGRWLDVARLDRREWLTASRDSVARTGVAGPDAEPLRAVIEPCLVAIPAAAVTSSGFASQPGDVGSGRA
ncbi:Fic family protein [Gordonia sp. X0973]|uniref:Fic family protein n=1 Tax=Gordonia sp. X0973 TaxID=2742602 RepID=UPI000F5457EB|nr:Fic family protein [Gordonia sp. X0973]QKT07189.1 Fic family protein [Gordonia sp. X0973]